jgi:hypothetical protein
VNARLDRIENTLDARLGGLEKQFIALQRTLLHMSFGIIGVLIGILATQL